MTSNDSLPAAIERYFDALEYHRFEEAAAQFTEDCVYYHPSSYQSDVKIEGRGDLEAYFAECRGTQDIEHEIDKILRDGDRVAYVGHQYGDDSALDWFIVFAELKEGKISYYMSALVKGVTVSD
jgi:predicted SnoaL-like aldol condensation-catalyzing enzyme